MPLVLCDAGPLIALGKLNRLHLLADLYGTVSVPRAVYREAVSEGLLRGLPDALTVRLFWETQGWPVVDVSEALRAAYVPTVVLDPGETELLALAQAQPDSLILVDDEAARAEARRLNLTTRGTLGIITQAHRAAILSLPQTELLIREIAARRDIWISSKLCEQVLASLG